MRFLAAGLRWLVTSLLVGCLLAGLAILWIFVASALYEQRDDGERLAGKRAYLAEIERAGPGVERPPNFVVILFDDLGYGDLGVTGSHSIATPNLDALAAGGVLLTDYYAPAPVCSPSRAGLLTGRYPPKTRVTQVAMTPGGGGGESLDWIPIYELQRSMGGATRLPGEEITLAEVLKAAGYATAAFGKWHLGTSSPSLPNDLGFDRFEGLLSSNDQFPNPYYRDREVSEESPVDQTTLTERYTNAAVEFIDSHHDQPFFLYLPHTFPHRPLHSSEDQRGRSEAGRYGDVVEDLDRSVGRVVEALRRRGIEDRTLVMVSSDNGPWYQGSPGPHRGRKTGLFDGGFRVPFMASWPGTLPAGAVRSEMAMGIDVFPSVLALAGLPLPDDREIDGRDLMGLMRDGAPSPHEALSFYWGETLGAVRSGRFKLHIRRPLPVGYAIAPVTIQVPLGPWMFDLESDRDESYDVSERYPGEMARLGSILASRVAADAANPRGFH